MATSSEEPFCAYTYVANVFINSAALKTAGEIRLILRSKDTNMTIPVTGYVCNDRYLKKEPLLTCSDLIIENQLILNQTKFIKNFGLVIKISIQ